MSGVPTPRLTRKQVVSFRQHGFLALDEPVTTAEDLEQIRELLDRLFERFDSMDPGHARDLGETARHSGVQQIPEIVDTRLLEPRLFNTVAFVNLRRIARQLVGARAHCPFDHAIFKPPHNGLATEWHQDLAYGVDIAPRKAVHFWLALQPVTVESGCMHFVSTSHVSGVMPHRLRAPNAHALMIDHFDPVEAVACPLPAGGATIHGPFTPHYTGPNATDEIRRTWTVHFADTGLRNAPRALLRDRRHALRAPAAELKTRAVAAFRR